MKVSLSTPLDLPCGARLFNRLCKAALSEGLAGPDDCPDDRLIRLYRQWSDGGAGLLITGNVLVDRLHRERAGNMVSDSPRSDASFAALVDAGTANGNHLWMQINHCGRQTPLSINPQPTGPSAIRFGGEKWAYGTPRAATAADIEAIIGSFVRVATDAQRVGFTGVQIHAAHGYLLSQFLSPAANQRDDAWGGSLAGRARLLLEVVRATRAAVGPDFPVSVKLNSADFQKGGFEIDEAEQVVEWLGEEHIDLLELSGGTYERPAMLGASDDRQPLVRESTARREAYFLDYAARMKPRANMPIMVTGGFRTLAGMTSALNEAATDMIGLGRPMCADPSLPTRLLNQEAAQDESGNTRCLMLLAPEDLDPALGIDLTMAQMAWYEVQMIGLAQGQPADLQISLETAIAAIHANSSARAPVDPAQAPLPKPSYVS